MKSTRPQPVLKNKGCSVWLIIAVACSMCLMFSCTKTDYPPLVDTFGLKEVQVKVTQKAGTVSIVATLEVKDYERVLEVETRYSNGSLRSRWIVKAGASEVGSVFTVNGTLKDWDIVTYQRLYY